ncbi:MAG: UDP-2,3-diacylglucosamine diphosphatase LpxI [Alphaproteobacteria bacterium]|nr:UDP-2,3-diacylglucosamine diphosphatase LpxI [Alphaproteobacteria bacterium]
MKKLGIIAGSGALPHALIEACERMHRPFFVLGLKGHANPKEFDKALPMAWVRLGAVGKAFRLMKKEKVEEIVMIGAVKRPSFVGLFPDFRGMKAIAHLKKKSGDDSLLRGIAKEIESEGFKVVGIDEILPHLLAKEGVYTYEVPRPQDQADIKRGVEVAKLLGKADVGQSVIVQQGLVLAVEGIEGTDALVRRSADLKRKGAGGVLVKMTKPQQDRRMDLPTIGPQTVQAVKNAGFVGIAIQAGGVLISQSEQTVKLANQLGIFIVGVKA